MIDTNTVTTIAPLATGGSPAAWNVVALGIGAFITHLYHTVVNAGGVKAIARNFWNGPGAVANGGTPQGPASNQQTPSKQ